TLNFTASGLTNAISSNVVVSPNTADRLVFTTQPGGASRVGSPLGTQPVLKAQDAFGNLSTVRLPANLNVALALTAGSGSLLGTTSLDIGTAAGNGVATFSNVECSNAGTNKQLTASAAGVTNLVSSSFNVGGVALATAGSAISADTVGGTYTTLTGPAYYQAASTDISTGTIILNAPAGFIFDASGTPAPTVLITRIAGTGGNNINNATSGTSAAITSRTTNQITFTVSAASSAGVTCSLIWQNVRVRPAAGNAVATFTNLEIDSASTNKQLTASASGFTNAVSSTFTVSPAAADHLAIQTQPSATATAGSAFASQPVIRITDAFGNLCSSD